jgi:lysophospholipase L1-like esterase
VATLLLLTVPTSVGIGFASSVPPLTIFPSSLPSAGGLVSVQIDPSYVGACPLTTTNPGVSLANCSPPKDHFDVWIPPNTQSTALVTTFKFSGSIGGQPTTTSSSVTQAAPTTSLTYVALGDSYSSGEGNLDARNGGWVDLNGRPDKMPTANDGCDRSWLSFPRRTATWMATTPHFPKMQFVFLACSGETTSDIWSGSPATSHGLLGPTLRHLEGVQLDDTPDLSRARIVTLTAGANDVNFAPVGASCPPSAALRTDVVAVHDRDARAQPRSRRCTARTPVAWLRHLLSTVARLEPTLAATYAQIEAEAPNAAFYVMGYPYLVPPSPSPTELRNGCDAIPGSGMSTLARLEVAMDTAVKQAARAVGAHYVDPNGSSPSDFPSHTVCSQKGVWFNGLLSVAAYSYHPNAKGQVRLFEYLRSSIQRYGLALPARSGK